MTFELVVNLKTAKADALHPLPEGVTVNCIAVAEEVGRRGIV